MRVSFNGGAPHDYRVVGGDPAHYEQFYEELSRDFGPLRVGFEIHECRANLRIMSMDAAA